MSSRVLGPAVVAAYFTSAYFVNVEIKDPYLVSRGSGFFIPLQLTCPSRMRSFISPRLKSIVEVSFENGMLA